MPSTQAPYWHQGMGIEEISASSEPRSMKSTMASFMLPHAMALGTTSFRARACSRKPSKFRAASRFGKQSNGPVSSTSMSTAPTKEKALKIGVDAAVEDFIKTGMNICIGDGDRDVLTPLLDRIGVMVGVEGLVDVAFVATNPSIFSMLNERNLPSDLAVNFKRDLDLYIAPTALLDEDCNAVLESTDIAADKYAASSASQVVLLIHEDDFETSRKGIRAFPVQLSSFLPESAVEALHAPSLIEIGVQGATLRSDGSNIADVSLAAGVRPNFVVEELERLAAVVTVGFLSASSNTVVVLATNDLQPVDMTSPLQYLAGMSEDDRKKRLSSEKRETLLHTLEKEWRLIEGRQEGLLRKFSFTNAKRAQAFVRYIHHVSALARHHPEIKENYSMVQVCLTTYEAGGLSELDVAFAGELSRAYSGMTSPMRSDG